MPSTSKEAIARQHVVSYNHYRDKIADSPKHIDCPLCGKKVVPRNDGSPRSHFKDVFKKNRCVKNPHRRLDSKP